MRVLSFSTESYGMHTKRRKTAFFFFWVHKIRNTVILQLVICVSRMDDRISSPLTAIGNSTSSSSPPLIARGKKHLDLESTPSVGLLPPRTLSTNLDDGIDSPLEQSMNSTGDPSEEESIALARMLMAQEALDSYAVVSRDFLRYNSEMYSSEDLEALQAALHGDDDDEDTENDEQGPVGGVNVDEYELMLRLGEAIGDVKQERWKIISQNHVSMLPTYSFTVEGTNGLDANDSRCKCLVCQCEYEEGETLRRLPCEHCFHMECIDQWLHDKDCCAYCRQPIVRP
jgi:Ring finger domain